MRKIIGFSLCALLLACSGQSDLREPAGDSFVITVIGTNDVHGEMIRADRSGGLTTFSGYVEAIRATRAADGGEVLLIDAGDMWQGTLEANLVEGESVVAAYNAMGYTAVTIGNHEFDFGPAGELAIPAGPEDDPVGALKQRIIESDFPYLAANIIDEATGLPIDWENVAPSVMVEKQGIRIGIIGLLTINGFDATASANTVGLTLSPLAAAIKRETAKLRADGADLVIVTAHAGGRCGFFGDSNDLSSCNSNSEIFRVARALPPGHIDLIVAGHAHQPIAHVVNGIAITSAMSNTFAFDRVDFTVDRRSGEVLERKIFPPQMNCPAHYKDSGGCAFTETDPDQVTPATYEGQIIEPTPAVAAIAAAAVANAEALKSEPLGVTLATPFKRDDTPESPLARLFTDAILFDVDADISIHNVSGGIRADLPAGPLTYGDVYEISPFDNRVVVLAMSGADLRRIITAQAARTRRRAGFSGMQVFVDCIDNAPDVRMVRRDGSEIRDDDRVRVSTNDFLATLGDGILFPGAPADGYAIGDDPRFNRDLIVAWFKNRGGTLSAGEFAGEEHRRWHFTESFVSQCQNGV